MTTYTVTNINLEKALANSANFARENLKDKVQYVKGIMYNPKKVKMTVTKAYAEMISKAYAFKSCVYDVDSKCRNNIAYHSDIIDGLMTKDTLTEQEQKRLDLHKAERAKTQAGLRAFIKHEKDTISPILDDIASRLYEPYTQRQIKPQVWADALGKYFESYEMKCDKTVVTFLSDNVGSRMAKTKDWHKCMVDNMVVSQFAELVLACLLQLAIDKSIISMTIVESTLTGASEVPTGEIDDYVYIKALRADVNTTDDYIYVLTQVGATLPKAGAKKADYVKTYNQAKKSGLFVEYNY